MKRSALLVVLCSAVALAGYSHVTNLSSSGTSTSYTFSPRPLDGRIAVQCHGGDARLAFGKGSATAVAGSGLRIIADTPAEPISLNASEDTIAMIPDENAPAGTVKCDVLTAPVPAVQVSH